MRHSKEFRPLIAHLTPPPALSVSAPCVNDPHLRYLESLGTMAVLMGAWVNDQRTDASMDAKEISARLADMAEHVGQSHCPRCELGETREAETLFLSASRTYMASEHRRSSSSLIDVRIDQGEDGDGDSRPRWPFIDLLALLTSKKARLLQTVAD